MVEITKDESKYLVSKGCRWHEELFSTTTRNHFYAVEVNWVLNLLNKYRGEVYK